MESTHRAAQQQWQQQPAAAGWGEATAAVPPPPGLPALPAPPPGYRWMPVSAAPPAALPGTPGGQPLPREAAQPALGTPHPGIGTPGMEGTPALDTPAALRAWPDAPAGATPPSVRYTPGMPAVEGGLLGGLTPSPAPYGGGVQQPSSPWMPSSAADPADSPPPLAGPAVSAPASGGPQVSAAPKPAFASWSAAAAAAKAQGDGGGAGQPARQLKQACLECQAEEAVHVWVPW